MKRLRNFIRYELMKTNISKPLRYSSFRKRRHFFVQQLKKNIFLFNREKYFCSTGKKKHFLWKREKKKRFCLTRKKKDFWFTKEKETAF